jgi:hypothetical protein
VDDDGRTVADGSIEHDPAGRRPGRNSPLRDGVVFLTRRRRRTSPVPGDSSQSSK